MQSGNVVGEDGQYQDLQLTNTIGGRKATRPKNEATDRRKCCELRDYSRKTKWDQVN